MRTIASSIVNAVTEKVSARMYVKAYIDPSRTFFKTLTENHPYDASPTYEVPTENPVGQCMLYYNNKAYTFISDPTTGVIYGMTQGSSSKTSLGITAELGTKPACASLGNGSAYVWWWDGDNLKRITVTLSDFSTSGSTTVTLPAHPNWSVADGSPIALSTTSIVFCYKTSIGGIGVDYYDGNEWFSWDKRFMSPKTVTATKWTIHTAATILNENLFVYSTDMDSGVVRGVEFHPSSTNDTWTDTFIALPADLSRFCISNALTANGYVHLSGQYHRTGDLAEAKVYSLVVRSSNGRTFSWDRFTLLSTLGYHFGIALDTTNLKVYASDRNCVGVTNMSYFFCTTPPDRVTLSPPDDIISFSLTNINTATLRLSSYDERYMFHDIIKKGARIQVYFGYDTTNGIEYSHYQTYIISARGQGFSAGKRSINLGLEDEGTWKTKQIAFPFYAEILSKTTQLDDCDVNDRHYPVETKSPALGTRLVLDFTDNEEWDGDGGVSGTPMKWADSNGALSPETWTYAQVERRLFRTIELDEYYMLDEYPVTVAGQNLSLSLYGWERTEDRVNSTWAVYIVTAPADDLTNKTATGGTLASTYAWFPRDYPTSDTGSYPIQYTWVIGSGGGQVPAGHVVLYFGISVFNNASGTSVALPERLEIDGLDFTYVQDGSSLIWTPENPDPETYDQDYLKYPSTGIPSILLSTKPYTAFNFRVAAEFLYIPGGAPLSPGTTAWGCVGLAKDGKNAIIGRYKRQNSKFEIVRLRAGVETVVANVNSPYSDMEYIMLDHRDGLLRIYYRNPDLEWVGPTLSYHWNEVTYGAMSNSDTGIMHTGIYGSVNPPGFYCCSYAASDGKGIAMIPGFPNSMITDFPSSGSVLIDGKKYNYTGKSVSNNNVFGPYQGRQSGDYGTYKESGNTFSGTAAEIALYKPLLAASICADLLFATEYGHTWIIEETDWTVTHYTKGKPNYLRNRSRHYADTVNGDYVGPAIRSFIAKGLTGISKADTGPTYMHALGSFVYLWSSDTLYARRIITTQVDQDATVEDMISYLCRSACVEVEFPGNWYDDSIVVSTTPQQLATTKTMFPGGFDIRFDFEELYTGQYLSFYVNNLTAGDGNVKLDFGFRNDSGILYVFVKPQSGTYIEEYQQIPFSGVTAHKNARILFHDEFLSFYIEGQWIATFGLGKDGLHWPKDALEVYVKVTGANRTLTNVSMSELFDWREAIYVESEMNASSALGSVIQERPIEIAPLPDGRLQFSYNIVRDTITYTTAQTNRTFLSHFKNDGTSGDAGSDAMVYFTDIAFAECLKFAEEEGFLTRVYKLSGLDTGAGTAATILLEKAFESQYQHTIQMRPDPRIEPGDKFAFTYIVPGTNTNVSYTIIVEAISISIEEGQYIMTIGGREDL